MGTPGELGLCSQTLKKKAEKEEGEGGRRKEEEGVRGAWGQDGSVKEYLLSKHQGLSSGP